MSHRQPDETYFIEDDSHATKRKYHQAALASKRKQEAMANELSRQACETYMDDIMKHMYEMELLTLPDVASIDIQQEIQWFMRPYLIDFLVEAHAAFQLLPETLFLAINLLDRYCSRRVVYKRHYQLVGCASLLIAAKYGDRKDRVPLIRELKSMCCNLYDEDMFSQMEWHVLNTLEWMIGHPTVDSFLQIAVQDGNNKEEIAVVEHMSSYICEIATYHKEFVSKKPSVMAAAALTLARGILGRSSTWEVQCPDVRLTLLELSRKVDCPSQVLYRKYASPQSSRVALIVDQFLREQEVISRQTPTLAPPTGSRLLKSPQTAEMYPGTPQKLPYSGNLVHGYMTPPITPDGEYFVGENNSRGSCSNSSCPITPSPCIQSVHPPHATNIYQHSCLN
ncbi:BgTH12-03775 [Blumeria graminis f. sp. triticale]|uniref:BgtA-20682 n=3 Tax=Blumeria graminis TaxID=34373 RepID=A0A9X9L916_BLUGR|nr:hypothetical protein BGT96224_A20682 [Blumeria graminis f. sp. tritici 96224]CAD6499667.1 BgTH12-03775 [Blumeria graminis f. sp. triticale]VCU39833.1 BgtA-20682 [Blumeria graminis f. sp. tritici]